MSSELLAFYIRGCKLEFFNLSNLSHLSDRVEEIEDFIQTNETMTTIYVSGAPITHDFGRRISQVLQPLSPILV